MSNEQLANEAVTIVSHHIVCIQNRPFALAGVGEILRRQLRDEIEFAMDDGLTIDEACEAVIAKLTAEADMSWWRRNGSFIKFAKDTNVDEAELNAAGFRLLNE